MQYGKLNLPEKAPFGGRVEFDLPHPPLEGEGEWGSAYVVINFRDAEMVCLKDYSQISRLSLSCNKGFAVDLTLVPDASFA